MRSTFITKAADIERAWFVIDATDHTLGRLSSEIAKILKGKNKPIYAPNVDAGDNVIVINAEKIKVTGKKMEQKVYRSHSGYTGGFKEVSLRVMMEKKPTEVIKHAVRGMLPKNTLGRDMGKKLHVYVGNTHEHGAQQPVELVIKY